MRNSKYHLYLTQRERKILISSLIDLKNNLLLQGKYTDGVDELLFKLTNAKVKKIKTKEV